MVPMSQSHLPAALQTRPDSELLAIIQVTAPTKDEGRLPVFLTVAVEPLAVGERRLPDWVGEHFQRNQYKLLRVLWGRGEVLISECYKTIYDRKSYQEEALDKVKDRVNHKLAEINKPYEIVTRRGVVYILR